MASPRLVSGIQTSGQLHLGNYLGALKRFVQLQDDHEAYFFLADLHSVTVPQEPAALRNQINHVAAAYLACGVDPRKAALFRQSDISAHAELGWLLTTLTNMGELRRMTQFKDKSADAQGDQVGVGLFTYPSLMAADILLYEAAEVPVGDDQVQHIELTRDLAQRFNNRFGETFVIPQAKLSEQAVRIKGLDDPTKKMSKSAASEYNYIGLGDDADTISKKIKKAVTDSGSEVQAADNGPAIQNLLNIQAALADRGVDELASEVAGTSYGDFKQTLADVVIETLKPIREKLEHYQDDPTAVESALADGAEKARPVADATLAKAKSAMGL